MPAQTPTRRPTSYPAASAQSISAPDAPHASPTARQAGSVTAPGCNDEVMCASSSSKPWMAVPLASAASAGLTFSARAKSDAGPPALKLTATSPAILPHGLVAPNSPQPIESSRQSLRCERTSAGTDDSVSSDTQRPSSGVTAGWLGCASIRLLHRLFEERERFERGLVHRDAEPRAARRLAVAVLHD